MKFPRSDTLPLEMREVCVALVVKKLPQAMSENLRGEMFSPANTLDAWNHSKIQIFGSPLFSRPSEDSCFAASLPDS